MKAQVVAVDRQACVNYLVEIRRLLAERATAGHPLDEAAVVMSVAGKGEGELAEYKLSESGEEALLKRFRTLGDPLKFLVVTSKLGTGFNAPIEGVMYLDKPLKDHTLFQTITRTNRNWKNSETGQEKRYGLVVDYVGLGAGFARAMAPANPEQEQQKIDVGGLLDTFEELLEQTMLRFAGIDPRDVTATTLLDSLGRLPDDKAKQAFGAQFKTLAGIWELVYPDSRLSGHVAEYRFLAKVYEAVQPPAGPEAVLWERLGVKTLELVHGHMTDIRIDRRKTYVVADAETIAKLAEQDMLPEAVDGKGPTVDEIIDTIAERLKRRQRGANGDHPVWKSLADRLEDLRLKQLRNAQDSIDLLSQVCEVATDLRRAEKAEDEQGEHGLDLLPDPNTGALTQIFHEYAPPETPETIEKVVLEIDAIVKQVTFDNWSGTQKGDQAVRRALRKVLGKYQLHTVDDLFDRAYAYISEHY